MTVAASPTSVLDPLQSVGRVTSLPVPERRVMPRGPTPEATSAPGEPARGAAGTQSQAGVAPGGSLLLAYRALPSREKREVTEDLSTARGGSEPIPGTDSGMSRPDTHLAARSPRQVRRRGSTRPENRPRHARPRELSHTFSAARARPRCRIMLVHSGCSKLFTPALILPRAHVAGTVAFPL